jgi:enoyl-CoA hydratase/carnithine racemase
MELKLTRDGGVASVTLASLDTGNALDARMVVSLHEALTEAVHYPGTRAIVIRAEGPSFCSGLAREAAYHQGEVQHALIARFEACLTLLGTSPAPTIACVEGVAAGGGVGLAAACDLVLAGPEARFSLPEARFGLIPATIAPYLLRRLTPARFRALALSLRAIGADEGLTLGLVDERVEAPVEAALTHRLRQILKAMPEALSAIKGLADAPDAPGEGGARLAAWLERPDVKARLSGEVPS